MSVSRNPWGSPAAASARSHSSVNLFDVMDEELAAKLQREEEEQFELEIAGRFGDDRQVGWCFVEVPSAGCEFGVMSVVQQEVPMTERAADAGDDPDYTFALELQAQEAEEYDRLRRQEEASMERIRIIQQEHPKREEIRQALLQKFYFSGSHASAADERDGGDTLGGDQRGNRGGDRDDAGRRPTASSAGAASAAASPATKVAAAAAAGRFDAGDDGDDEDFEIVGGEDDGSEPQSLRPHAAQQPVAAGNVDRVHLRDLDIHRGIYIDGDDLALPRKKLNSLSQTLKHADRKQRSYHHSYHRRGKTHGDQTTETT